MIWKRKCDRYRLLLALDAGHDLDEQSQSEARRHAAFCPQCREYWQQVQTGQRVLEETGRGAFHVETGPSLWPALSVQLPERRLMPERETWIGWLPAGALAAACVAVLFLVQTDPSFNNVADSSRADLVQSAVETSAEWPPEASPAIPWEQPVEMRPFPKWVSDGGNWNVPLEQRRAIPVRFSEPRSF